MNEEEEGGGGCLYTSTVVIERVRVKNEDFD